MPIPHHIIRFLNTQSFEPARDGQEPGSRPFVTIARQAGAGGRSLAAALLEAFARGGRPELRGWQWVDRQVCEGLAADPRLGVTLESLLDERFRGKVEDYLTQALSGRAPQLKVHRALFSTLRSLAGVGRVIIVGRGGVCATRGFPGGVHVRLVGSRGARLRRVMVREGWDRQRAEAWLDEQDRGRARLLKSYFGARVDDPLLFDAVFNTDIVSPEAVAEAVADLVLDRARVEAAA